MKETRLSRILHPIVYNLIIKKYIQFIRNGEKEKALGLKRITYICIHPKLKEDGSNPWRMPNDFLYEVCTKDRVFEAFYRHIKEPDYDLFGKKVNEVRAKLL